MSSASKVSLSAVRLLVVGAFAAFVALAGMRALPPLDRDEARFAQATVQMLESGDYVSIRYQDRERNKKPAGIHWLQAASVHFFSDVEAREIWVYRIPSMIGVILASIFVFMIAQKLYDQRTAFLAGLLFASAPVIAAEATIAKTDGVLLAMICLAQWAFVEIYARTVSGEKPGRGWATLFWGANAIAVLIKGPIGPLITFLTGLGMTTGKPRLGWVWPLRPVSGFLFFAAIITPWLVAIGLATEGRFFTEAIGGDMLGKIGTAQEHHAGPPGYHAFLVWALFWPAAALLLPGLVHIWRDRAQWQARFLLSWLIPAWLIFEFAATKLPHYVMPLYPALAIIAAHAVMKDRAEPTRLRRAGAVVYGFIGMIAALLVAALLIFLSEETMTPLCFLAAALIAAISLFIARLFWLGRAFTGGVTASLLAAVYAWTLMTGVLPALTKLAVSPRISATLEELDRHPMRSSEAGEVALAGYFEPSAVFLLGTDTVLTSGANAANLLAQGAVDTAIIESRSADNFTASLAETGIEVRALAVIDGVNYSNAKRITLTIYGRDRQ